MVYRQDLGRFAYFMKDLVIKVKYISLVNLIAEKEAVKELIAHLFTVKNMTDELDRILNDEKYRAEILNQYAKVKDALGDVGASKRAAKQMVGYLKK